MASLDAQLQLYPRAMSNDLAQRVFAPASVGTHSKVQADAVAAAARAQPQAKPTLRVRPRWR
eukprot:1943628-Prymnesium_polylepis.1